MALGRINILTVDFFNAFYKHDVHNSTNQTKLKVTIIFFNLGYYEEKRKMDGQKILKQLFLAFYYILILVSDPSIHDEISLNSKKGNN